MMESKQSPESGRDSLQGLSEYTEAKERFNLFSKNKSQEESSKYLNDLIRKLCNGEFQLEAENGATLFYEILYQADYVQIKVECRENFYTELCEAFILSNLFSNIDQNLEMLEAISQVKIYLVQGLFKLLRVVPEYEDNCLVLKYSSADLWYNIDLKRITYLKINPCAYKVMLNHPKFDLTHLNFIFRLLRVKKLILNGCNLNGRNVQNLFKGLHLNYLGLSKCGTNVNVLFEDGVLELKYLSDLDISGNPLYNSTLKKIQQIPLISFNINDSVKTTGTFINSIWFARNFPKQNQGEECKGNLDILWEDGNLHKTIQVLHVNHDLTAKNARMISSLKLVELNIGNLKNVDLSQLHFSNTLRSLQLGDILLGFNEFARLCRLPLEKLSFRYRESTQQMNVDFFHLIDLPLSSSLKELTVYFEDEESSENILTFFSQMKLIYFKCYGAIENERLDKFICDYEQRKYLVSLFINGELLNLSSELINGISKLKLIQFGIDLPESIEYHNILSLKNLQERVETLLLTGQECRDRELEHITKFKKVTKLSFSITAGVSANYLQQIAHLNTLKCLNVEAMIKGQLNIEGVHSLCAIPIHTLHIFDDYGRSVSDEAFQYLSETENLVNFCRNGKILNMRSSLKLNMAKILGNISWETIKIQSCEVGKDILKILFQNKDMRYTLEHVKLIDLYLDSDMDWEHFEKLLVSEMIIEQHKLADEALNTLASGPISKFLRYILFEDRNINRDLLLGTNISEVDTY